ncbi:MAG: EAL domain-containing protein [Neptuniibacter sp.]
MQKKLLSLKFKLLLILLPGSMLALALALGLAIYQSEQQFQQKSEEVKQSIGNYADLMVESLWNFDTPRVENIVDTMMLQPNVLQVEVFDESLNPVVVKSRDTNQGNLTTLEFPLIYKNAHISQEAGTLKVIIGDSSLRQEKQQYIQTSLVALLLIFLILSLGVWATFTHLFDKPINALLSAIKLSHAESSFIRVSHSSKDELGEISDAFNAMQGQLDNNHQKLQNSRAHLNNLYHSTPAMLFSFNQNGEIQDVSAYFLRRLGYNKSTLIGSNLIELLKHQEKEEALRNAIAQLWNKGTLSEFPLDIVNETGDTIEMLMDATLSAQSSFPGALAVVTDVTGLNQARRKLEQQANTDYLSGISNRFYFLNSLTQLINDRRSDGAPFALLFIDLDHFKSVNDTFGHHIGDQLIRMVTERITHSIRPDDSLSRLGGDEFGVILKHLDSPEMAEMIAKRILSNLQNSYSLSDSSIYISASIGIALFPKDGDSPEKLLQCADLSMYRAKEDGRCCYAFYSDEHNQLVQKRLKIETLLRSSIVYNLLEIHYQPIVCLESKKMVGIEALLRLRDQNTEELISPADFIPIAEETGLIVQIGAWCLEQSCHYLAELQKEHDESLYLSVNVSTRQFQSQDFISSIKKASQNAGITPSSLLLEITESLLLLDNENNLKIFNTLKEEGFQIAIDDFGTGYSALSYLMKFPLNVLKIDRSFINYLINEQGDNNLVNAIIHMARSMNLRVIAEGVETNEQLSQLKAISGDVCIQGFLFSRPITPEQLLAEFDLYSKKARDL